MNEWVWSIGGMILTGETEVLGEKHYTVWVVDQWMSVEHWWNDTDRGNWSAGRKTLYSVGGRWMNECGALVEWYWQGKREVLRGSGAIPVPLFPLNISHGLRIKSRTNCPSHGKAFWGLVAAAAAAGGGEGSENTLPVQWSPVYGRALLSRRFPGFAHLSFW